MQYGSKRDRIRRAWDVRQERRRYLAELLTTSTSSRNGSTGYPLIYGFLELQPIVDELVEKVRRDGVIHAGNKLAFTTMLHMIVTELTTGILMNPIHPELEYYADFIEGMIEPDQFDAAYTYLLRLPTLKDVVDNVIRMEDYVLRVREGPVSPEERGYEVLKIYLTELGYQYCNQIQLTVLPFARSLTYLGQPLYMDFHRIGPSMTAPGYWFHAGTYLGQDVFVLDIEDTDEDGSLSLQGARYIDPQRYF